MALLEDGPPIYHHQRQQISASTNRGMRRFMAMKWDQIEGKISPNRCDVTASSPVVEFSQNINGSLARVIQSVEHTLYLELNHQRRI